MLDFSAARGTLVVSSIINPFLPGKVIKLNALLLLSILFFQVPAIAQQPNSSADSLYLGDVSYSESLRDFSTTIEGKRFSPFLKAATIATVGAGTWVATFALVDEPLQQFTQSHRNSVSDNIAYVVQPLGRAKHLIPVAGLAIAGGFLFRDPKLEKLGIISMGSLLTNSLVTSKLKGAFLRNRPSATTENHVFEGDTRVYDNSSLPSSHTSTAFAMATSVALVYNDNWYIPATAYGIATLVGLSRINDNAHWATDVMAGALVGYISARSVNYMYEMAAQNLKVHRQKLLITPQFSLKTGGVNAVLTF